MGWKGESRRHSLSRKGIKTVMPDGRRFDVSKFVSNGIVSGSCPHCKADLTKYGTAYDGAIGYEATVCRKCGWYWDHNGIFPKDDWSEKIMKSDKNSVSIYDPIFRAEGDYIPSNPQMTFEDLVKTPVQDRVGIRKDVTDYTIMKNGSKMSIQASRDHYSLPQTDEGNWTHIEVVLYGKLRKRVPNGWKQYEIQYGGEPTGHYAYVPVEKVRDFINKNGGQKRVS